MLMLTPVAYPGATGARFFDAFQLALQTDEIAATAREPFITGPDTALWVGFIAFILIFLLVMIAFIRGRVIKPAKREAKSNVFFEPAGEDAEIVFDHESAETELEFEPREHDNQRPLETEMEEEDKQSDAPADESGPPHRKAAFSGLFAKRRQEIAPDEASAPLRDGPEDDFSEVTIERREDAPTPAEADADERNWPATRDLTYWEEERERQSPAYDSPQATDDRQRLAMEQAHEERQRAIEEAERARSEADEQRRQLEFARANQQREAAFERKKAEAALEQRMQSLADMQRRLTDKADTLSSDTQAIHHRIGASLDQKFATLSDDLMEKLNSAAAQISKVSRDFTPQSLMAGNAGAEATSRALARQMEDLRNANETALNRLSDRIDNLSAAQASLPGGREDLQRLNKLLAERSAPAVAGALQLTDLVRSALPAERYAFDRKLRSGAVADCLISTSGNTGPFAVDARFPVDAFEKYARADEDQHAQAVTQYRRAILRHMIFVAEKLIVPGETADFAIMFLPSDTVFNDLHRNFPDIVQDSYRARLWIVSPTSLMATLHMMSSAAARFAEPQTSHERETEETRFAAELAALSARLGEMEREVARQSASRSEPATWKQDRFEDVEFISSGPREQEEGALFDDHDFTAPGMNPSNSTGGDETPEGGFDDRGDAEAWGPSSGNEGFVEEGEFSQVDMETSDEERADESPEPKKRTHRPPFPLR